MVLAFLLKDGGDVFVDVIDVEQDSVDSFLGSMGEYFSFVVSFGFIDKGARYWKIIILKKC